MSLKVLAKAKRLFLLKPLLAFATKPATSPCAHRPAGVESRSCMKAHCALVRDSLMAADLVEPVEHPEFAGRTCARSRKDRDQSQKEASRHDAVESAPLSLMLPISLVIQARKIHGVVHHS